MMTFAQFVALDEFALPTPPSKITKNNIHKALGLQNPVQKKKPLKKLMKKPKIKAFSAPKIPSLGSIVKKAANKALFGQGAPKPADPNKKTPAKKARSLKPLKTIPGF